MKTHRIPRYLWNSKPIALLTVLLLSFAAFSAFGTLPGAAQSEQAERQLEDKIPKHLPIKVKVKNLNSERWERDLEIEVKNVSGKPIYYMRFGLAMPEVINGGNPAGFALRYGRGQLRFFKEPLSPDDTPIPPGETYIFKLSERDIEIWEEFVRSNNIPKGEPRKLRLILGEINFGDGTGFHTMGGLPIDIHKKQSRNDLCPAGPQRATLDAAESPGLVPGSFQLKSSFSPASFLPVKFSPGKSATTAVAAPALRRDVCCPGQYGCSRRKPAKYTCCYGEADTTQEAACTDLDPDAVCGEDYVITVGCCPQFYTDPCPPTGGGGCTWDRISCSETNGSFIAPCYCDFDTPVLIDVRGDGFSLTDAAGGVRFDINATGAPKQVAWTARGSDDAWLALDRDGNGQIDDGGELFGDVTPQQAGEANGFRALAEYDRAERGGNADGVIDGGDAVFSSLRLWRDSNHDGVSQPGELQSLPALDIARLHLDYKESKRVDRHGNQFRYRAKVDDAKGAKAGRWAWDVFHKVAP